MKVIDGHEWPLKVYPCNWSSTKKDALLCSACFELFLASLSLFQVVMTCTESIAFSKATTSKNVLTCKFTINRLCYILIQNGAAFLQFKTGARCITKFNKYYEMGQLLLQSEINFITKWDIYYKVGQYMHHMLCET